MLFLLLPTITEASLARRLGSRYGGTLSTNNSLGTQQLTSDPATVLQGSVSTEYDPAVVSLIDLLPSEFFNVSALIGVRLPGDPLSTERFVTDTAFFGGLPAGATETGYVQVSFQRFAGFETVAQVPTLPGYVVVDTDGETEGDETHALFFGAVNPAIDVVATYQIYQEDGTRHAVLPDYLTIIGGGLVEGPIEPATVSSPIPEPTAGLLGVTAAAGALAMRRRRR